MENIFETRLKSIQPYFVLGSTSFLQHIYLKDGISHFFGFAAPKEGEVTIPLVTDGCSNLIFEYDKGCVRTYLVGSTSGMKTVLLKPGAEYFGVRFLPVANPYLTECSPKEAVGQVMVLDDIPEFREFISAMEDSGGFGSRIATFLRYYDRSLRDHESTKKECLYAQVAGLVVKRKGLVKVGELEDLSGYTGRYLNKIFESQIGLSAKQLCTAVKFQAILDEINSGKVSSLTTLSGDYQFYDQAHFIHEFKSLTGRTPREYCREVAEGSYVQSISNV